MKRKNLYKLGGVILGVAMLLNFGAYVDAKFDGVLTAENLGSICEIGDTYINCNERGITMIESGTFNDYSSITDLYLYYNQITIIEKGTFSGLTNLKYLYLIGNPNLGDVDYSDFEDMGIEPEIWDGIVTKFNVEEYCYSEVYMDKNTMRCEGITSIASGAFDDYEDVQMIGFRENYIKDLDASLFEGLDNLEFIMIQNNYYELDLSEIEAMGIAVFTGELNDKNVNYVCSVENDSIGKFINCNDWGITKIASGTFLGLRGLPESPATIIHLNNNDIETLEDGAFNGIQGDIPTYVDLQNNDTDGLNMEAFDGLYGGFNVGEYQFGDNTLEGWINLGYLSQLGEDEEIDMIEYYGLDKYVALDLGDNMLEEIEDGAFNGLSNLQSINLESNNLSELDKSVFAGLENLQELDIGDNSFECIPEWIPEWIYNSDMNIKYDDLKVCGLLDYETIQGLCNLSEDRETLDCSDKGITYLDSSAFDYDELEGVKNVILSGNGISELYGDEFQYLPSLEYVNLRGNPLYCYPNLNEYFGYEEGDEVNIEVEADGEVPMCKVLSSENMLKICDVTLPGYLSEQYGSVEGITYDENNDFIIDCSNRGITSISPYVFDGMNMEGYSNYVYLRGNIIKELKEGTFSNLVMNSYAENVIDLRDNKIETIENGGFMDLKMYGPNNKIHLENNEIKGLNDRVFIGLTMQVGRECPYQESLNPSCQIML